MVHNYPKRESRAEILVMNLLNSTLQQFLWTFYVRTWVFILHLRVSDQIVCSQPCLPSRRYEDNNRFSITEFLDMIKGWLIHGCHPRAIVFFAEPLEMDLNWNRPDSWSKIEEAVFICAEPLGNISAICHSRWKTNHSNFRLFIHPWNDNFENSASFLSQQMNLIEDNKPYLFSILPLLATSDSIPFLWSRYYDIGFIQCLDIRSEISAQLDYGFLETSESRLPVF